MFITDHILFFARNECRGLLYSPMARKGVWVDASLEETILTGEYSDVALRAALVELADFIPLSERAGKVREPEDYPLLTVLPTQQCNLACSYCYSAQGRSTAELDRSILRAAIDFFLDSGKDRRKELSMSFMGGGEPMLSWDVVREAIVYAKRREKERCVSVSFTIITNGTLLSDDAVDFIARNDVGISVSFDILEDIQQRQRGQYDVVKANIDKLISCGVIPQINATITTANVGRMEDMQQELERCFPQISKTMFEPVTSQALFASPTEYEAFLAAYHDGFFAADERMRRRGGSLTSFPYLRTVFPTERACAGELCLTPEGMLTGCYCISSTRDAGYDEAIYGRVERDRVEIDRQTYRKIMECNMYTTKGCENCEAKWHCGGGCFYMRRSYGSEYMEVFCDFTRRFVKEAVLRRYERLYERLIGVPPGEDWGQTKGEYKILSAI